MKRSRKLIRPEYIISENEKLYDFLDTKFDGNQKKMCDFFIRGALVSAMKINNNVPFDGFKLVKKVISDFEIDCRKHCATDGIAFSTGLELKKVSL